MVKSDRREEKPLCTRLVHYECVMQYSYGKASVVQDVFHKVFLIRKGKVSNTVSAFHQYDSKPEPVHIS